MRLIDADAIQFKEMDIGYYMQPPMVVLKCDVDAAPTVDAVPVVRCRDCKNSNKIAGNETMRHCWNLRGKSDGSGFSMVGNDGYCDEGERKEPDHE